MNIDKSNRLVVIDFDDSIYHLLKEEYIIVKHTNHMQEFFDYEYPHDMVVIDSIFQDGDVFEFVKKCKKKPYLLGETTSLMKSLLKNKVHFVQKDDFFIKDNYLDIEMALEGYKLFVKALNAIKVDELLLTDLHALYSIISKKKNDSVERSIRYYKESLIDANKFESKYTTYIKPYPTNSEFLTEMYDLMKDKKIKVD